MDTTSDDSSNSNSPPSVFRPGTDERVREKRERALQREKDKWEERMRERDDASPARPVRPVTPWELERLEHEHLFTPPPSKLPTPDDTFNFHSSPFEVEVAGGGGGGGGGVGGDIHADVVSSPSLHAISFEEILGVEPSHFLSAALPSQDLPLHVPLQPPNPSLSPPQPPLQLQPQPQQPPQFHYHPQLHSHAHHVGVPAPARPFRHIPTSSPPKYHSAAPPHMAMPPPPPRPAPHQPVITIPQPAMRGGIRPVTAEAVSRAAMRGQLVRAVEVTLEHKSASSLVALSPKEAVEGDIVDPIMAMAHAHSQAIGQPVLPVVHSLLPSHPHPHPHAHVHAHPIPHHPHPHHHHPQAFTPSPSPSMSSSTSPALSSSSSCPSPPNTYFGYRPPTPSPPPVVEFQYPVCLLCGSRFDSMYELQVHARSVHGVHIG